MSSQNFPKAFAVWFKDLRRWDPASFHEIAWHWPKDVMQPIGRILSTRKEKVDRTRFTFSDLQPITIHFDGSIDRRNVDATREYTMDLFFARSGDIIVAKIDLKNGAVAIVPDDWENVVVTGHFAVYKPDRTKIIPEYFHRIIQTSFFKAHLWRNKVGAEGRKEVKLDYFESLEIPIPPIPIQKEIMAQWQKAQEEIKTSKERVEDVKQLIETKLLQKSGITLPPVTLRKGAFVLEWRKFERWDTFFYREDFINLEKQIKSRRHATLGEILNFTSRSWKTSDFSNGAFEYIEISNVTKDKGIIGSKKIDVNKTPSRATTLLKEGDIILATTRPYLGAFTVVSEKYANPTFAIRGEKRLFLGMKRPETLDFKGVNFQKGL